MLQELDMAINYSHDGLLFEDDDYNRWFAKNDPRVDLMKSGLLYNNCRGALYVLPEYFYPTAWVGRTATDFIGNESL